MRPRLHFVFALLILGSVCRAQSGGQNQTAPPPGPRVVTAPQNPPAPNGEAAAATAANPPAQNPSSAMNPPVATNPPTALNPSALNPSAPGKTAETPESGKSYVIGPLDVLYVRVWNNQNLTGMVDVGPDGMISMPLIGEVKADGFTREQLREVLQSKLSSFLNSPEVDVQLTRINSKKYFIFGGVNKPGEFPLTQAMSVLDALSIAGGFKDFANPKKIYVLRGTQKLNFNYKDVSRGKNMEQNINLQNGDRIFVPE